MLKTVGHFENIYLSWFDNSMIDENIARVIDFYKDSAKEKDFPLTFLTKEEMDAFVTRTAERILEKLRAVGL